MMGNENGREQFEDSVFKAELEEIGRRRANLDLEPLDTVGPPSTSQGLVGLALSGGGIRSATFSLGVLQALASHKILKLADYLSTVSGGGYIGSCLSSVMNRPDAEPEGEAFPFAHTLGAEGSAPVEHLRNSGNYLAPGGFLDKLRIPTVILRGILTNLLSFLPYLMLMVILAKAGYALEYYIDVRGLYRFLPAAAIVAFLLTVLSFPFISRYFRKRFSWANRNGYELWMSLLLLASLALVTVLPLLLLLVGYAIDHDLKELTNWLPDLSSPFDADDWWKWLVGAGILVAFLLVGKVSGTVSTIGSQVVLAAMGLIGPALLLLIFLGLCAWQIQSPLISGYMRPIVALLDKGEVSEALFEDLKSKGLLADGDSVDVVSVKVGSGFLGLLPVDKEWRVTATRTDGGRKESRFKIRADRPDPDEAADTILRVYVGFGRFVDDLHDAIFIVIAMVLFWSNWRFLDINITAPHGFYRDRLSKAYLFRQEKGGTVPDDEQKLHDLNGSDTKAPYHLINVTLNLHGSKDPNVRGRNADFFVFSKHYTGSVRTGFVESKKMEEEYDGHLNLGTAMAISGAAAAPNMGLTTVKPLVFIMTLLNIRLGYWLPNPSVLLQGLKQSWRGWRGPGPRYLWKEAVGDVDAQSKYVNVSDGGHLENLAIYELLRRRCKLIISVDGGADPDMTCGDLAKLIRFARIDMGIQIRVKDDAFAAFSRTDGETSHYLIAEIEYGNNETGYLLYLKASLTGDENPYVKAYHARESTFPHQSTADQFFDETQFECYRALGYHIANRLFRDVGPVTDTDSLCKSLVVLAEGQTTEGNVGEGQTAG